MTLLLNTYAVSVYLGTGVGSDSRPRLGLADGAPLAGGRLLGLAIGCSIALRPRDRWPFVFL